MNIFESDWFEFIFQLIQSLGIIITLVITIVNLLKNNKYLKSSNSLMITQNHGEIWINILNNDDLKRVFDKNADIVSTPVTEKEHYFTNMIFLHMSSCLKMCNSKSCFQIEGMKNDIKDILSYPIPNFVWTSVYKYHDKEFVDFVMHNI